MSAGQRGGLVLLGIVAVSAFFCYLIPFVILPGMDAAMALPVIQLPGEKLVKEGFPLLGSLTNTAIGILIADIIVLAIAFTLRSPKLVPQGFQNLFELIVEYLYNLTKQVVGTKSGAKIFPLVASIFLIVLVANWIELIPGVDSIGLIHCAEEGMSGYPIQSDEGVLKDGSINLLKVEKGLDGGTIATEADYHACEAKWFGITEHAEEETHAEDDTVVGEEGAAEGEGAVEGEEGAEGGEEHDVAADEHETANADILIVTPFVRAAATDLNMTLSLALIAFLAIQFFGTQELGLSYYTKFINLPALGNLGKKPMGAMDFVVGLLEIISELAKILSFGFRLFGNIFAGQVLLFVMAFLVATLLPGVFYGLELFVGLIQAFVFFMLTLVFSGMAMEGHHGDDDHH